MERWCHFPEQHEVYLFIWAATNLLCYLLRSAATNAKHGIIQHMLMFQHGQQTVVKSGDVAKAKMLRKAIPLSVI